MKEAKIDIQKSYKYCSHNIDKDTQLLDKVSTSNDLDSPKEHPRTATSMLNSFVSTAGKVGKAIVQTAPKIDLTNSLEAAKRYMGEVGDAASSGLSNAATRTQDFIAQQTTEKSTSQKIQDMKGAPSVLDQWDTPPKSSGLNSPMDSAGALLARTDTQKKPEVVVEQAQNEVIRPLPPVRKRQPQSVYSSGNSRRPAGLPHIKEDPMNPMGAFDRAVKEDELSRGISGQVVNQAQTIGSIIDSDIKKATNPIEKSEQIENPTEQVVNQDQLKKNAEKITKYKNEISGLITNGSNMQIIKPKLVTLNDNLKDDPLLNQNEKKKAAKDAKKTAKEILKQRINGIITEEKYPRTCALRRYISYKMDARKIDDAFKKILPNKVVQYMTDCKEVITQSINKAVGHKSKGAQDKTL